MYGVTFWFLSAFFCMSFEILGRSANSSRVSNGPIEEGREGKPNTEDMFSPEV